MKHLFKILTISLFIISCKTDINSNSDSQNLPISRFEQKLFSIEDSGQISNLKQEHPEFFDIYVKNVLGAYSSDVPAIPEYIEAFTSDPTIKEIYQLSQEKNKSLSSLEKDFGNAFGNYKIYFPDKVIPRLISFVSGFSYTIIVDDSLLAFGLDMYLGKDCEFYPRLGIPKYKFHRMSSEYIVSDCMKGWLSTEYELEQEKDKLIDLMIYHGKLIYASHQLMPEKEDHILMRYDQEQIKWCIENEADIWFHIIENELLYESESSVITKFMGEAPFTPGFPEGSPGEIGKWVGWRIVNSFMEKNDYDLNRLLSENIPSSEFLNRSKYKPEK